MNQEPVRVLERYSLYDEIAAGGMATVHIGRLLGPVGFSRTVAIKRLHPQFAKDPEFASMFLDEARLAARVRHPNVVPTLDVVSSEGELFLVMEYIQGESLSRLQRTARTQNEPVPVRITVAIIASMLDGLHAAHEARSESGEPLEIVHRDVSPQNVLVGTDGVSRVLDFGVAKATGRLQVTREGQLKGKMQYMAPEQLLNRPIDRRVDLFASGVVLWEALVGERLFRSDPEAIAFHHIAEQTLDAPSQRQPSLPPALDAIAMKALARDPADRFATAREMAMALEAAVPPATAREIAAWVDRLAGASIHQRTERISLIESSTSGTFPSAGPASTPSHPSLPAARASHPSLPAAPPSSSPRPSPLPASPPASGPSPHDELPTLIQGPTSGPISSPPPSVPRLPPRAPPSHAPPPHGPPPHAPPPRGLPAYGPPSDAPPSSAWRQPGQVDPVDRLVYGSSGRPAPRAPSPGLRFEHRRESQGFFQMAIGLTIIALAIAILFPGTRAALIEFVEGLVQRVSSPLKVFDQSTLIADIERGFDQRGPIIARVSCSIRSRDPSRE
jgi:serine/threonine-protein kinase